MCGEGMGKGIEGVDEEMTIALRNLLQTLWQWCYPKEFRIEAPTAPAELMVTLKQLIDRLQAEVLKPSQHDDTLLPLIGELATGLWRMGNRLRVLPDGPEDIRRLKRVFQALWEAMGANGVEIRDHTSDDYDAGMALEVLTFQTDPTLEREKVIETIKPSVYVRGKLVQWGVVIVGKPTGKEVQGDATDD